MNPRIVVLAGMLAAAVLPLSASAITTDELRSQIASLLAAISQLQSQIGQLNASSTSASMPLVTNQGVSTGPASVRAACPALTRSLQRGATGSDVRSLQSFLFASEYLGADGVTGYFGALTEAAVKRWQTNNGIAPSGLAAATVWGAVGAQTRVAMLAACDSSVPQNDTLSIGARELSVIVRITVNTSGSCKAVTYSLDYGDGTPVQTIFVPANTCRSMQQTFTYTYASGGSYTVRLFSGASRISAPVTLTAPPVCRAPVFATDDIPGGVVGVPWTLPLVVSLDAGVGIIVSATGTPPGIVLSDSTSTATSTSSVFRSWVLTGAPTAAGTYHLTLNAKNSCGGVTRTLLLPVSSTTMIFR